MSGICNLLDTQCILLDLDSQDLQQILETLVGTLSKVHPKEAPVPMMEKVFTDPGFSTVCMGLGCAISHARCTEMEKTLIAVARLSPPCDLGADDKIPVSLFFLLIGPQSSPMFHIKILSRIARLLHESDFREKLEKAKTSEEFHQLICQKEQ
ncbi:PTS sugar transporter subunit IIA [uncultured Sphaerochaeta sp.]|uniref:PTS sugar transporter subunit IIA n=1 Tax=uncultured Sphaerochaeta sp. TaxID=886478 RepID=UPI002A0A7C6D|nr:PTS sugar transporter subunit IIA [uncultured Sphaerochaeta sp.]